MNEDNYAALPPQENRKFLYSDVKKTVNITWNTVSDENVHRRGAENICENVPGPRGTAKYAKTPVEAFTLFFTKSMIKNIVRYTIVVIQPAIERFSDLFEQSDKYPHSRLVDQLDVEAFIGILYLRAAFRVNLLNREFIWNRESSHDVFAATMSENRFKFISCFTTFDDKATRADR